MYGRPLALSVEVFTADGSQYRWDANSRNPDRVPQGISFATKRGDGFGDGAVTLARRVTSDYPDLGLYDTLRIVGTDGSVAYEGRVAALPRSSSDGHTITIQTAGWMIHAKDQKFTGLFIDRDTGGWHDARLARRTQIGSSMSSAKIQASVTDDGLAWEVPAEQLTTVDGTELHYDAGSGRRVASIVYMGTDVNSFANFETAAFYGSAAESFASTTAESITLDGQSREIVFASGPYRYVMTRVLSNNTNTPTAGTKRLLSAVAVVGDHGISTRTAPNSMPAVTASDVIKHTAGKWAPKLDTTQVTTTSWPIPHLVFNEPISPYDAWLGVNAHHAWELAVWEGRRLHYYPADLSDADWHVRLTDNGTSIDLQGDTSEELANGVIVTFQDAQTGVTERIGPDDYPELADAAVENPANRHGLDVHQEIQLTHPTLADSAAQIGRTALAEINQPKQAGTITITGHIRDRAGHWQPGWAPRAGETVAILDHPNTRPRLITETRWEHDGKRLTLSVDSTMKRLDAILDRIGTALTAANLT